MPDASQFTLALFDSTGLGGSVPTPLVGEWFGDPVARPAAGPFAGGELDDDDRDDDDKVDTAPAASRARGCNLRLDGDRGLARGWTARARDNLAAILLSKDLEVSGRTPTPDEQRALLRFTGFGATELAQNAFPLPGTTSFRDGWETFGRELADAVTPVEYAALQRATQYAHYTPEPIVRAMWQAAQHLGFAGGRVLEPGMGTGLFFSLIPEALVATTRLTGIEYDPVTARIAKLVHPEAHIRCEDYTRSRLGDGFDLAIGNPPFADRTVRADPTTAQFGLRLHDYFIARSIARLRPGGLALFVTSTGTMDKSNTTAREHIASMADLVGAVRLPEGSMAAAAGTHVVIDVLVFQRRAHGQAVASTEWIELDTVPAALGGAGRDLADDGSADTAGTDDPDTPERMLVNRYFVEHPEMVLGQHAMRRSPYGPGLAYTCRRSPDEDGSLEQRLGAALARLPAAIHVTSPESDKLTAGEDHESDELPSEPGTAAEGATIKEGSYAIGKSGRLVQIIDGQAQPVPIRDAKSGTPSGIPSKSAKTIRALLPIRDAVREVLRAQAADRPWTQAQVRLRVAYSTFIRFYGPINHTVVSVTTDAETGEERESHRRPNLAVFADDPDCWLVASIEDYDLDTGLARMGPIFRERVVAPPAAPVIATAADALAVTLADTGRVDVAHLAELLECDPGAALVQLGATVFRNPRTEMWETADAYLSGAARTKLAVAEAAAAIDPQYARNVTALRDVQPDDLRPSDITARLGAPWLPTEVIEAFATEVMGTTTRVSHCAAVAFWNLDTQAFAGSAAGTSEWGTSRRHAGFLLHDALNSANPQVYDTAFLDGRETRVLNVEATEAAKEKLARIRDAFTAWVWTEPDRTDRLARLYNDRFNNLVARHFDGSHLTLPGASNTIRLYEHQKRVIWRIIAAGGTYMAHAVGAGKTFSMAAAVMEQRRLGLISKAMIVVPGHCLAQASREFLQLYPTARILVADETNFARDKRARFLARAATATWDAVIITHSAFRFIAVPAAFERGMVEDQIALFEAATLGADAQDRTTRKRIEAMKEKLAARLEALAERRDDMLTIDEIGIDQIVVDEAQEFRKLSFATNQTTLKGVDPDGSQRAWDLFVKSRFVGHKNPGRALIQASGTPITNTLGELYTVLRFQAEDALRERGIDAFDAWAASFGDTRTELELQPSGAYKPVERFCEFINLPELIDMFRSIADVVLKDDLRRYLKLPQIAGGQRELLTSPASPAFKAYQKQLAHRIKLIEARTGRPEPGDDILLSVITDGRHAAIDMRLVCDGSGNEPENKLNRLIENVHRIWNETAAIHYRQPDGSPYPKPGAGQLVFSDLGTIAVEDKRRFSAYRWIKQELTRLGVPASEVAFMQDFTRTADKQRLFNDFNAGRVRVLIGSSQTMGTGVNVQARLVAEHHLDVPWLPSQIEQREGRIERQGNQNDWISIHAYATLGSMDATMWQNNERKRRFIDAALSGDRSIRRIEDVGSQANQFAMAKAIASGNSRLMQKAGLDSEIARLRRQRAAYVDDQHAIRRRMIDAKMEVQHAETRIAGIRQDLARRTPTRGDAFSMEVAGRPTNERKFAGASLLTKVRMAMLERDCRDWVVGRIGCFELICSVQRLGAHEVSASLLLRRHGYDQEIKVGEDLTPMGVVTRLEHVLDGFEGDLAEQTRRRGEAISRHAAYSGRVGGGFPLEGELGGKLAELAAVEADLARGQGETTTGSQQLAA